MAIFDAHENLCYTNVATAPSPATSGTSLTVSAGTGALFPAAPYNCTVYPPSVAPDSSNAEIIRVTARVGDVLTIVRAQEGTTARSIAVGWQIANTMTVKTFTDIENAINVLPAFAIQSISGGTTVATGPSIVFSNSNNVSFGVNGNTVTASVSGGGAALSAGTQSGNTGTIVFSNSNGISFGMSNSSIVTASYSVPSTAGLISAINFSAGTTSNNLSAITFSNSNGVSFGLNGSTVTASVANSPQGSISAGTTSVALGQVIFSNSNNISFGLNGSTVTASATVASSQGSLSFADGLGVSLYESSLQFGLAPLDNYVNFIFAGSTLLASVDPIISISAGTTDGQFDAFSFSDSNNVSFGINGQIITASVGSSQGSINFSAGATSNNLSAVTFSNSNNVSFGLNGSTITGSVATSLTNINFSAGTTSNNLSALVFSNSNSITFGLNGSTVTASYSQTNQQISAFAVSNTSASSSGTLNASNFSFQGAEIASVGVSNGSVIINVPAGAPSPVNFSAGTTSNNLGSVVFSNSNGMSFGLNGSTITGSVDATSSLLGTLGISISTNGSTIYVFQELRSSYENFAGGLMASQSLTWNAASISHAVAFAVPYPVSASFLRIPILMTTNSTTLATLASATATASGNLVHTFNAVVYSLGSGASSKSLMSVASGSCGFTFSQQISVSNSTQGSYSLGFSAQAEGGQTTRTTQYSISNTNYSFTTNQFTAFTSNRFLDIPFANSLSAGPYWLVVGNSSTSTTAGAAGLTNLTNCNVRYSAHYGVSQVNLTHAVMGSTNQTSGGLMGAGSFSTAGGGTTSGFDISAISSWASNNRIYFQLLRSA